jgi:hypothetical protein
MKFLKKSNSKTMQIINKIITGGKAHKSRFHDEKGNLLDWGGFVYLPSLFSQYRP